MYYKFEKLEIWILARDFISEIYLITRKFPQEELFSLVAQIRRAAISIILNITEGCNRTSKEFCRFLRMALTSLEEVVAGLYVALDQKFITLEEFEKLYKETHKIAAKINSLINSIKNS